MDHIIRVNNLRKSFFTDAGEIKVLKGVNLSVEKGEIIAIEGASGVGKSTFLHVIGTIDKPNSGSVYYNGKDIFDFDEKKLTSFRNRTIGFIFQFHHLLPEFSAMENTIMPGLISSIDKKNLLDRGVTLLSQLGLKERITHRPGELSGGEQQRVAIARALILNPLVVLADEPTGNLDARTGDEIFDLILELNRKSGITFIIVTHNRGLAQKCNRVYRMTNGVLEQT